MIMINDLSSAHASPTRLFAVTAIAYTKAIATISNVIVHSILGAI